MHKKVAGSRAYFSHPRLFLAGVACGLLICSVLGRFIASRSHYVHFVRPGGPHSIDPSFFLTASQVKTTIESLCRRDQVLVLVGGDSILFGADQPVRHLWSKVLNDELGPDYCVINLAAPAGGLAGFASVALEMVANEYPRKVLVSDSVIPPSDADGMLWYKYFFWDAYYKGLLNHSIIKRTKERMSAIRIWDRRRNSQDQSSLAERRLGMWLDSYLYFNDLWTSFHYRVLMTRYYTGYVASFQWIPHRDFGDYDYEVDTQSERQLKSYPAVGSAAFNSQLAFIRSYYNSYFSTSSGRPVVNQSMLMAGEKAIHDFPNTEFSNLTLIALMPYSPYYTDRLSSHATQDFRELLHRLAASWEKLGYHTVVLDNAEAEDYGDPLHLNTLGGDKLAAKVAIEIRSIFRE